MALDLRLQARQDPRRNWYARPTNRQQLSLAGEDFQGNAAWMQQVYLSRAALKRVSLDRKLGSGLRPASAENQAIPFMIQD
jgi:hypothetical protein